MAAPRKHYLIVEITDMSEGLSTRRVASLVRDVLKGNKDLVVAHDFANVQVKDKMRVERGRAAAEARSLTESPRLDIA